MARKKSTKKTGTSSKPAPAVEAPPALPLEEPVVEPVVEEKPVAVVEAEPAPSKKWTPESGRPTPEQVLATYETAAGMVYKLKQEQHWTNPVTGEVVKKVTFPKS